ncbi:hypothetical protein [Sphingomonas sp.]|uniref:hypothetical protein n=1 Tax=Sphingomonas sp. TaxID=28214 RepID=UPI000DB87017|nr:hypothetical protein [Sphingomonas sp.]PZU08689.1 MAG: hypothetical protein DI605_12170 [Sphingomonas sp.]
MRAARILAAMLTCAALAAPALSAKRQPLSATPDDLSIQAVHNYGACIAETTPKGAAEALALDYQAEAYRKKVTALSNGHNDGRCMSWSRIRYSGVLLAGSMAETLLRTKTDAAHFPNAVAYDESKPAIQAHDTVEYVAMCVVRTDPAKSWAILSAPPTSPEEKAAMQGIGGTLTNCVPANQKMALNRPGLRAAIALAAYHMMLPAAPAQGS